MTASEVLNCRVGRALARDPSGQVMPVLTLTAREMKGLSEYSATIPTGKTIGKRWRCRVTERGMWSASGCGKTLFWTVGEYAELSIEDQLKWPGEIAILWYLPSVDGAAPGCWEDGEGGDQ